MDKHVVKISNGSVFHSMGDPLTLRYSMEDDLLLACGDSYVSMLMVNQWDRELQNGMVWNASLYCHIV